MAERVTLLLGKERIEVSRADLISKSEYFATLLSPNFKDSLNSEQRINYDIGIDTLRTFVNWASDHVAPVIGDRRHVKPSLSHFVGDAADFDGLLLLLQLAVLFAAETLIRDVSDLIACHWLLPERSVQIWLLARELNLPVLRDLAKAACVERLRALPESQLLELPGEDFIELVGNIRVYPDHGLLQRWLTCNNSSGEAKAFESHYPFTLLGTERLDHINFEQMYGEQLWKHNVQCIVGLKQTANNEAKMCIYGWDGSTFSEMIELPSTLTFRDQSIVGMRVVGRGYDIYLVGGEYGKDSKNYQTEVWRYSMISKTWYYVTSMPRARRNMAIQFSNEDLVIVGGTQPVASTKGSNNIDVCNVHTGQWRDIPGIPEYITNTTVIYDDGDFVALWENACGYTYYEDEDEWLEWHGIFLGDGPRTSTGYFETSDNVLPRYLMKHHDCQYVLGIYERDMLVRPKPKVFWFEDFDTYASFDIGDCLTRFDNQVGNGPYLVGFSHKDNTTCVEVVKMNGKKSIETNIVYNEKRNDVVDLLRYDPIGCFNVYNPKSLNEILVLKAKKSRNRAEKSRTQAKK